jgi:hypothetical protein
MSAHRSESGEVTVLPWLGGLAGWCVGFVAIGDGPSDAGFAGVVAGFDAALVLVLALRPPAVAADRTMRMLTTCTKLALIFLIVASTISALEGALQTTSDQSRELTRAVAIAPFAAALGFVFGHLVEELTSFGRPRP